MFRLRNSASNFFFSNRQGIRNGKLLINEKKIDDIKNIFFLNKDLLSFSMTRRSLRSRCQVLKPVRWSPGGSPTARGTVIKKEKLQSAPRRESIRLLDLGLDSSEFFSPEVSLGDPCSPGDMRFAMIRRNLCTEREGG